MSGDDRVHSRAPGAEEGLRVTVSRSLAGGVLASALLYAGSVLAGRLLGPEAFGRIGFAVVLAQLASLLAVRGLDFAAARTVVLADDPARVRSVVGTAYGVAGGGALTLGVVLVVGAGFVSDVVGWPVLSVVGAGLLLVPVTLKALNERILPALRLTTTLAVVRPAEGVLLLGALATLWLVGAVTPDAVLAVMVGSAFVVVAALVLALARRHLVGAARRTELRSMRPYAGAVLAITLVPLPLQYGDRLVIEAALPAADLGLYLACVAATQLVAGQVVALVSGVLLPHLLRQGAPAVARLRRTSGLLLVPAALGFAVALVLTLVVLGPAFAPPVALVVLLSVLAGVQLVNGLLHVAVLADQPTLRLDVRLTAVRAVLFVGALAALAWSGRASLVLVAATVLASESVASFVLWRLSSRVQRRWTLDGPPVVDA